jgi:hypothetical protein
MTCLSGLTWTRPENKPGAKKKRGSSMFCKSGASLSTNRFPSVTASYRPSKHAHLLRLYRAFPMAILRCAARQRLVEHLISFYSFSAIFRSVLIRPIRSLIRFRRFRKTDIDQRYLSAGDGFEPALKQRKTSVANPIPVNINSAGPQNDGCSCEAPQSNP